MEIKFNHILPLQLRFNDIDALGHVNNSVYFQFYDLGKALYFNAIKNEETDWTKADIVVANVNNDFFAPMFFQEPIAVQTTVTEIGNKSFKMLQQIVNTDTGQVKSVCRTVMVGFDRDTQLASELKDEWKLAIRRFEKNNGL